jgi:predicted transcriptional regulator of viral defense system
VLRFAQRIETTGLVIMNIQDIRSRAQREEIDYVSLKSILSEYGNVRMKISHLIRSGDLVRVKKGLYVFGDRARRGLYCMESLANLIFGPSAISMEYALSFYGMIPERVSVVTSVTPLRNKHFATPVGNFSYTHLHPAKFSAGIERIMFDKQHPVLIASREKALADLLTLSKASPVFSDMQSLRAHIRDSLRIDDSVILSLNMARLRRIHKAYSHKNTALLAALAGAMKGHRHA